MIFPPPQVVFGLLLLSTAVVLIFDIRYNPFGNSEDDLLLGINSDVDLLSLINKEITENSSIKIVL